MDVIKLLGGILLVLLALAYVFFWAVSEVRIWRMRATKTDFVGMVNRSLEEEDSPPPA